MGPAEYIANLMSDAVITKTGSSVKAVWHSGFHDGIYWAHEVLKSIDCEWAAKQLVEEYREQIERISNERT